MISYWLAADFFSWLWWLSEEGQTVEVSGKTVNVIIDSSLSLKTSIGSDRAAYKGNIGKDARRSFGLGKQIDAMLVVLKVEDRDYEFRLAKGGLRSYKVKLPLSTAAGDDRAEALHENLLLLEEAEATMEALFVQYLDLRVNHSEELLAKIRTLEDRTSEDEEDEGGEGG